MKAVVFHGIGDTRFGTVSDLSVKGPPDATMRPDSDGAAPSRAEPMSDVIDVHKRFDLRRPGWIEVEPRPGR